jgi:formate dehydrogenase subunit gamma
MKRIFPIRTCVTLTLGVVMAAVMTVSLLLSGSAGAQSVRPPSDATINMVPGSPETSRPPQQFDVSPEAREAFGQSQGDTSRTDFWSTLRHGAEATTAVQGPQAGYAIQSSGEGWRQFRNGPIATYGWWGMAGVAAACLLFFLFRGSMPVASGLSGKLIERFTLSERAGHWVIAISFLVLGLTGLNMIYGKDVLLPAMGPEAFAAMSQIGKYAHFAASFIFMIGIVWIFVKWIPHNLPDRTDLMWFLKGGGYLIPGVHAHAKKFNPGQKIVFWLTVLGGISVSLSGLALLLPFEFAFFAKTFGAINAVIGTELPTKLSAMQEMQLNQLWHAIVSLFLLAVIVAHIYLGTIGLQGAFQAMTTGKVDLNWAKEHHDLWVEELEKKGAIQTTKDQPARAAPQHQPAE